MEAIPTDILVEIFHWIPGEGLITCCLVCKRWRDVILERDEVLFKPLCTIICKSDNILLGAKDWRTACRQLSTFAPVIVPKLHKITDTYTHQTRLPVVPGFIFENTHLKKLRLYQTKLERVPAEISRLSNLEDLSITYSSLTQIPEIYPLTTLQILYLYDNKFTTIPDELCRSFRHLTDLSLSGNQLTSISEDISLITNLKRLYLYNNKLTHLPSGISALVNLGALYITSNQLTSLPPEISNLTALSLISAAQNEITSLPAEFAALTKLTDLSIGHNQLKTIPVEFTSLVKLTKLQLEGNPIETLPPQLTILTSLEKHSSYNKTFWSLYQNK